LLQYYPLFKDLLFRSNHDRSFKTEYKQIVQRSASRLFSRFLSWNFTP